MIYVKILVLTLLTVSCSVDDFGQSSMSETSEADGSGFSLTDEIRTYLTSIGINPEELTEQDIADFGWLWSGGATTCDIDDGNYVGGGTPPPAGFFLGDTLADRENKKQVVKNIKAEFSLHVLISDADLSEYVDAVWARVKALAEQTFRSTYTRRGFGIGHLKDFANRFSCIAQQQIEGILVGEFNSFIGKRDIDFLTARPSSSLAAIVNKVTTEINDHRLELAGVKVKGLLRMNLKAQAAKIIPKVRSWLINHNFGGGRNFRDLKSRIWQNHISGPLNTAVDEGVSLAEDEAEKAIRKAVKSGMQKVGMALHIVEQSYTVDLKSSPPRTLVYISLSVIDVSLEAWFNIVKHSGLVDFFQPYISQFR